MHRATTKKCPLVSFVATVVRSTADSVTSLASPWLLLVTVKLVPAQPRLVHRDGLIVPKFESSEDTEHSLDLEVGD